MASLPTPGASVNSWGSTLNTWLQVAHNSDGTLKGAIAVYPSGDTTGAADLSTLNAAITALPSAGGAIIMAPGAWYLVPGNFTISVAKPVFISAYGAVLNAVAGTAGDLIRWYDSSSEQARTYAGGCLLGLVMNGASATGATNGLHLGDVEHFNITDVQAWNFASSKGFWFDNQYNWTEQLHGSILAANCLACVQFDNSTGTANSASAGGSFDRAHLNIFINQALTAGASSGDGVIFAGGATSIDYVLNVKGNIGTNTTSYSVLKLTGSNAANFSNLGAGVLNVGVECDDTLHTAPMTIKYGSASNYIYAGSGILDFSGSPFTASNKLGSFNYQGLVYGDSTLAAYANYMPNQMQLPNGLSLGGYRTAVALSSSSTISTGNGSYVNVSATGACTGLILGVGTYDGQQLTVVNTSAYLLTFAAQSTSHVAAGTSATIAALTSHMFVWDSATALWYS